jgi:hypothetical protein
MPTVEDNTTLTTDDNPIMIGTITDEMLVDMDKRIVQIKKNLLIFVGMLQEMNIPKEIIINIPDSLNQTNNFDFTRKETQKQLLH